MKPEWDLVVVGGGPAGMVAAAHAAERGKRVVLLEKNPELGRKLLITGGGRCNITNAIADRHVLTARYGEAGVHLHSLFARFGPDDTRALFRRLGLETVVEAEGRVFPITHNAASVRDALESYLRTGGVTVRTSAAVAGLVAGATTTAIAAVRAADGRTITAKEFALATGGSARPETGSSGDALPWLRELGVPVRAAESALVPIRVPDEWVRRLQGLALAEAELIVEVTADGADWANARRALTRRGKLLFTHFGLSGPLALNAAVAIRDLAREAAKRGGAVRLRINPLPGADPAELERRITGAVAKHGTRQLTTHLREMIAPRLAEAVCAVAGVAPTERLATLSRTARRALIATITGLPCQFGGLMGQDKAVVSSGGVDPAAVDFRTMRLRAIPNLYVLGDLLDFNRQSGGFSLQVCWASGWVAGEVCGS